MGVGRRFVAVVGMAGALVAAGCGGALVSSTSGGSSDAGKAGEAGEAGQPEAGAGDPCGAVDTPGQARTLVSGLDAPEGIAVDATRVYWIGGGGVMTVPRCGGAPSLLFSWGGPIQAFALGPDRVYWVGFVPGSQGTTDGVVGWAPLAGGTAVALVTGQNDPWAVAVDGTSVYWVNAGDWGSADGTVMSQSNGTVMSMPLDGGAPTTLAAGQNFPDGIAVDATSVYWVDFGDYGLNDGAVMSIPIGQAADPVMLASGQPEASAIAVDATRVYWSCINGVAIAMVPLGGGTPETLGGWIGQALALDSTSVYWAGLSSILKVPLDGGATTTLASGLIEPVAVAVDTYSVYWTDQGTCPGDGGACSGAVMKLNPK